MQQVAAGPRAIKNWLKYHVPVFQRLRGISMHHPPFPATYGREVAAAYDAVRVAAIGLALTTIARTNIPGAIAELGVYRGETSRLLRQMAADRVLYLFDTFAGFQDARDTRFRDTNVEQALRTIGNLSRVIVRPGLFPDTARGLEDERFAFVMLDADRYQATLDGLDFFYPRLSPGGFIFVHDYHSPESDQGAARAVDHFFRDKPEWPVELPDRDGSVVIRKVRAQASDSPRAARP